MHRRWIHPTALCCICRRNWYSEVESKDGILLIYFLLTEVVEIFLSAGANIAATTVREHATPLHVAARGGHSDTIQLLVSKGANLDALDWKQQTPIFYALQEERIQAIKKIISLGAQVLISNINPLGN